MGLRINSRGTLECNELIPPLFLSLYRVSSGPALPTIQGAKNSLGSFWPDV